MLAPARYALIIGHLPFQEDLVSHEGPCAQDLHFEKMGKRHTFS